MIQTIDIRCRVWRSKLKAEEMESRPIFSISPLLPGLSESRLNVRRLFPIPSFTSEFHIFISTKYLYSITPDALKFLGHELGTQTAFKHNQTDVITILNGKFEEEELRKHLDKFIEKYVLCQNCSYPELNMKVKGERILGDCNACGKKNILDNKHKIATFIIKNPPDNKTEFSRDEKADTATPAPAKSSKKGELEEQKIDVPVTETVTLNDTNIPTFIQQLKAKLESFTDIENFDDKDDVVDALYETIKSWRLATGQVDRQAYIVFNSLFDYSIAKQLGRQYLLVRLFKKIKVKDPQGTLIVNIENLLLVQPKDANYEKYVPTILKLLFDVDLLSEEYLLGWAEGKEDLSKNAIYQKDVDDKFKTLAAPFIEWLKNAEEEGEEEEEEEAQQSCYFSLEARYVFQIESSLFQ
eukprot:TRINITY_DN5290_c0_g4_i3.p1 TRINITY_DN5290_c0_g4~~TRINITY_DN5290_c0_g4_i3.p1  ORF type:complete len:411 (-),score=130.53 TRINITY_DN5290_c0_g4_i3:563-1795(-)